jgi:hypothetical protein
MLRRILVGTALAFTLPAWAASAPALPAACDTAAVTAPTDETVRWRWQAYRDLDCLVGVVEQKLQGSRHGEDGQVTISRDELQQIRSMALRARDAAARIGR